MLSHPQGSLSHLFEWKSVVERAYGKRCFFLSASRGGRLSGILPLVLMRPPLTAGRLVSMPFLDQGGILADSTETAAALLEEGLSLLRELGGSGLDLRGPVAAGQEPVGQRFRLLLSLPDDEDRLWSAVGAKVRNQIRKSRKEGLRTEKVGPSELRAFYRVFARNMRDLGSPVHGFDFFAAIFAAPPLDARLYLTFDRRRRPIAGGIALRFCRSLSVPWASSLFSARRSCPNHSLYWKILSDAVGERLQTFDFGRSSAGTGTFHFKKQWGARAEPLIWSFRDSRGRPESDHTLDPRRNRWLAGLWRRLPPAVADLLGPMVRRQLSN